MPEQRELTEKELAEYTPPGKHPKRIKRIYRGEELFWLVHCACGKQQLFNHTPWAKHRFLRCRQCHRKISFSSCTFMEERWK